jgi:hypothetical protein
MEWIQQHWKAIVPGVLTLAYAVYNLVDELLLDGNWSAADTRNVVALVVTTLLTYLVPNKPTPEQVAKAQQLPPPVPPV